MVKKIGIETYLGISNRIFPLENIKPIDVLQAIKSSFKATTDVYTNHSLLNFSYNNFSIKNNLTNKQFILPQTNTIIAFGGKSWSKTGSDAKWVKMFNENKIQVNNFEPSNAGVICKWSNEILKHEGKPLKNIAVTVNNKTIKGETLITAYGLEGNTIYTLNPEIKTVLKNSGHNIYIDMKPQLSANDIKDKIDTKKGLTKSLKNNLKLSSAQISIIKYFSDKNTFNDISLLADFIKNVPLQMTGLRSFNEAISSSGGVDLNEINQHFELKKFKNIYAVGEMIDWDTCTGGYLLQGCFTTSFKACQHILQKSNG